jgi:hypothetical protein
MLYFGGGKKVLLLEGSQVSPTHPSGKGNMSVKIMALL